MSSFEATLDPFAGGAAAPADLADDARHDARRRDRILAAWFASGAGLVFLILVTGGITRLTQSGLSMVDWQPIVGILPPLNEAEWQEAFARYSSFPEYRILRPDMTLAEFKGIFFWEYVHRVIARLIGLAFLLPFAFFLVRGWLDRTQRRRALVLLGLGALQGFLGWYMVSSGLVDRPHVSHYRLGVHLATAFTIFGCCLWFALDLLPRHAPAVEPRARRGVRRAALAVGALLALQVFWGALVAGLHGGLYFNTFPKMGGAWVPPFAFGLRPLALNFVENPITTQWVHRILGTALALCVVALFARLRRPAAGDPVALRIGVALLAVVSLQYGLGVLTVLGHVPIPIATAHQATAMVLFGVWLALLHRVHRWPVARLRPL